MKSERIIELIESWINGNRGWVVLQLTLQPKRKAMLATAEFLNALGEEGEDQGDFLRYLKYSVEKAPTRN